MGKKYVLSYATQSRNIKLINLTNSHTCVTHPPALTEGRPIKYQSSVIYTFEFPNSIFTMDDESAQKQNLKSSRFRILFGEKVGNFKFGEYHKPGPVNTIVTDSLLQTLKKAYRKGTTVTE